jgi:hypothetical protein
MAPLPQMLQEEPLAAPWGVRLMRARPAAALNKLRKVF